jgi:thermolysin
MKRSLAGGLVAALLLVLSQQHGSAQRAGVVRIRATSIADIRTWDTFVTARERSGELRLKNAERDPALPGRTIDRLQQFYRGVPIWGADLVRDSDQGVTMSLFGELSSDLTLSTDAALSSDDAGARIVAVAGAGATLLRAPALTILRLESGDHRLTYMAVVGSASGVRRVFVDANTGGEVLSYSEIETQSAVGTGRGVLGDTKKLSVVQEGATFFADDKLRPPVLRTFDLRNNVTRAINVINGVLPLSASDRAADSDDTWTDAGVVDAHVSVGWTYDYYFKRFQRRGLDNQDRPITNIVNAVSPQAGINLPPDLQVLVNNAFWCGECGGSGLMYFGSGYPPGFVDSSGQTVLPLAGGLDVIAHELTHGVIDSSSALLPGNESGALNEAIADMMGTSVEFFFQTPGAGPGRADYTMGEDVFRGVAGVLDGIRSLANPQAYSSLGFPNPDNYVNRYTGPEDEGGVHINAGSPGNAFYLAIEGGTNRTSGLSVQGVGAANRAQIENVFYRAFVFLLPSNATFSTARAATIQAARDLYGTGSNAERAVTQAWTAVGVN